jgi:Zn-dependent protease with chaperone function
MTIRPWMAILVLVVTGSLATAAAETTLVPPANTFAPAEDVELGRQAAEVVRSRLPMVRDARVDRYLATLLDKVAGAIPSELRRPAFAFEIGVLDGDALMSVSLPGGPLFLTRGVVELAATEGQLAGLMPHELSHIVLRHGTAQATAGERFQIGAITGHAIGRVLTGGSRGIIERGADFSVWTYFLSYDRRHEQQADRLAVRLMAGAGYDPSDVAVMLQSIRKEETKRVGAIRWTRSHPAADAPTGRVEPIAAATPSDDGLRAIKVLLAEWSRASAERGPQRALRLPREARGYVSVNPEGESQRASAGDILQLSVPLTWRRLPAGNTIVFTPDGAFARAADGPVSVTHGIQVGVARSLTGELRGNMRALLASFSRDNPRLTWTPAFQEVAIAGRRGLTTTLSHESPTTGDFESVLVSAVEFPGDAFLYVVGVSPSSEASLHRTALTQAVDSLQIVDAGRTANATIATGRRAPVNTTR